MERIKCPDALWALLLLLILRDFDKKFEDCHTLTFNKQNSFSVGFGVKNCMRWEGKVRFIHPSFQAKSWGLLVQKLVWLSRNGKGIFLLTNTIPRFSKCNRIHIGSWNALRPRSHMFNGGYFGPSPWMQGYTGGSLRPSPLQRMELEKPQLDLDFLRFSCQAKLCVWSKASTLCTEIIHLQVQNWLSIKAAGCIFLHTCMRW